MRGYIEFFSNGVIFMYRNFIFDLYGTLIDIRTDEESEDTWERFADWLSARGMEYTGAQAHEAYNAGVEALLAKPGPYRYPEIDILPVFADICRACKPEAADGEIWRAGEEFRRISTGMLRLYDNSRRVLDGLRAAGKRIYLLSNAQRVFTWQELELTGIKDCFDGILISSDEGCKKPDTAFFGKLLDRYGLEAGECVMVGNDGASDIAGARAAGIDAVYLRTEISPPGEPKPDCKYVFEDGDVGHVLELVKKR